MPPLDAVTVGELEVWVEVVPRVFDVVVTPLPEVVSVDDDALVEVVAGLVDEDVDVEDEGAVLDVLDVDATGNAPYAWVLDDRSGLAGGTGRTKLASLLVGTPRLGSPTSPCTMRRRLASIVPRKERTH